MRAKMAADAVTPNNVKISATLAELAFLGEKPNKMQLHKL